MVRHVKDSLRSGDRIRSPLPPIRICEVPIGQKWCRLASFHKTDTNSVVVNYYQTGPTNLRQMAVMEILVVSTSVSINQNMFTGLSLLVFFTDLSMRFMLEPCYIFFSPTESDGRTGFRRSSHTGTVGLQCVCNSAQHIWSARIFNYRRLPSR